MLRRQIFWVHEAGIVDDKHSTVMKLGLKNMPKEVVCTDKLFSKPKATELYRKTVSRIAAEIDARELREKTEAEAVKKRVELVKKTLPSAAAASFIQTAATTRSQMRRATELVRKAMASDGTHPVKRHLILAALRSGGDFGKVTGMIDGMVAPSVQKRGFIISRLVSQWPLIAGDIAAWSRPSQMNLSRDGGGTLKLAIASGFGPIALQMKQPIIERVNAAFGYRAINDVVFIQTLPPPRPDTARTTTESASASDPKKVWELDAKLEKVSSPELRAALRRLGLDD